MEVSSALTLLQAIAPPHTGPAGEPGAPRQPLPPREAPPSAPPPAAIDRQPVIQGELIQPNGLTSGNADDGNRGFLLGTPSNRTPNGTGTASGSAARDGISAYEEEQGNAYVTQLRTATMIDLYV